MPGDGLVSRLTGALDADDGPAARRAVAELRAAPEVRDDVLDELAARAAQGSWMAMELLAETVDDLGLARGVVRRVLVDEAAVDDVAQDTLVSMAASIGSFRGEARFTTWLHRIARNRAVDHLRRQRAVEPLDERDTEGNEMGEAARISSMVASRQTVQRLLERLPATYRDAVLLRDVQRLPYTELAQRLGLNTNTAKSHVARGRALLARMVASTRDL